MEVMPFNLFYNIILHIFMMWHVIVLQWFFLFIIIVVVSWHEKTNQLINYT